MSSIVTTDDGSSTVYSDQFKEHYHSTHGAIQESRHVFIEAGLNPILEKGVSRVLILEVGFGTGLNVFLTFLNRKKCPIEMTSLEAYPLDATQIDQLNYYEILEQQAGDLFAAIHRAPWNKSIEIQSGCVLNKVKTSLEIFVTEQKFNLIYFDAFSPNVQPELWTEERFQTLYQMCAPEAVFVTYCAKGSVRRALTSVGFSVEKIAGPPGKREMIRATK